MGSTMTRDIGPLPDFLYNHGVHMITAFGVFELEGTGHTFQETAEANEREKELQRDGMVIPMWLCFSVGTECLVKAVLLKHEIPIVSRGSATGLYRQLIKTCSNYAAAADVCTFIQSFGVYSDSCPWMKRQLGKEGITHLYDLNTGTMNSAKDSLGDLVDKKVLSKDECGCLKNSLTILAALRRNIDAHTFFGLTISGNIQHDLEKLYLPAINTLAQAYHR